MTAEELAEHLDLSGLIAAGYTIAIRSTTVEQVGAEEYSYEIQWIEYPLLPPEEP